MIFPSQSGTLLKEVVRLQLYQVLKLRQVMFRLIFPQMLFRSPMDKYFLRQVFSTQGSAQQLTLEYQYRELEGMPRSRLRKRSPEPCKLIRRDTGNWKHSLNLVRISPLQPLLF